jgi:hypothetical protein
MIKKRKALKKYQELENFTQGRKPILKLLKLRSRQLVLINKRTRRDKKEKWVFFKILSNWFFSCYFSPPSEGSGEVL